ncbi:CopG family transcriptional regulator [Ramlibacter sp.]|uniref:CopG family transcriptional regulator n=1 Tax=Ramlibacter sp. TaxID=1917967 RepID=UPI0035B03159
MKNVTITVEEPVLEWVRVEAAKRNSSVSRLVGDMLAEKMRHEDAYQRAFQAWLNDERSWRSDGKPYPRREDLYQRGPAGGA